MFFWIFILFLCPFLFTLAYAGFSAAPWVPTKKNDKERLIRLAQIKPWEKVYELGCGNARVLRALVKNTQAKGVGVEISLFFWLWAWIQSKIFYKNIQIHWGSLFQTDLSQADVVYIFLTPKAHAALKEKFEQELSPGARVITYVWPIEGWEPEQVDKQKGQAKIYLYRRS